MQTTAAFQNAQSVELDREHIQSVKIQHIRMCAQFDRQHRTSQH